VVQQSEFLPQTEYKGSESNRSSPQVEAPVQDWSKILGKEEKDVPLYKTWVFALNTIGQERLISTDSGIPDYWVIYTISNWDAAGNKYLPSAVILRQGTGLGSSPNEPEIFLTGGGSARIPGTSEYMLIRSHTAVGVGTYVGVIAVRKSDFDVLVSPGNGV
jgi:hypothetical protein